VLEDGVHDLQFLDERDDSHRAEAIRADQRVGREILLDGAHRRGTRPRCSPRRGICFA
jgi:hypothetical protein